jgi:hypothetical protein
MKHGFIDFNQLYQRKSALLLLSKRIIVTRIERILRIKHGFINIRLTDLLSDYIYFVNGG